MWSCFFLSRAHRLIYQTFWPWCLQMAISSLIIIIWTLKWYFWNQKNIFKWNETFVTLLKTMHYSWMLRGAPHLIQFITTSTNLTPLCTCHYKLKVDLTYLKDKSICNNFALTRKPRVKTGWGIRWREWPHCMYFCRISCFQLRK